MKTIRLVILALLIQCGLLVNGCLYQNDGDYRMVEWTGIDAIPLDNSGREPAELAGNEVAARAFALRARMSFREVASLPNARAGLLFASTLPIVYFTQDSILSLRIARMGTGDSTADVTDDFLIRTQGPQSMDDFATIDAFIRKYNRTDSRTRDIFDFFPAHDREPMADVRFAITLEMSNGEILTDTTRSFTLR